MSDEIDLQLYLAALRRRWWVVLLAVLLALAIAFAISVTQPKRYQATATLLAQSPRYQWRFDASILPLVDSRRDYQREFLAISRSNRIAERAVEALHASGQDLTMASDALASAISTRASDGSTLQVTATAQDAIQAARLANAWAQAFVDVARQIYGVSADRANYEAELAAAAQRLAELESQMMETRTRTGIYTIGDATDATTIYSARQQNLDLKNQQLAQYLNDLDGLRDLQESLAAAAPDADLTLLPWERLDSPVLIQRGVLSSQTARERLADRAELEALLQAEETALAATAEQLADEIEQLQAQLAADWRDFSVVNREYNLTREVYSVLSRKASEAAIQERIDPSQLTLVSEAVPPSAPVQTRQLALWAVAAVAGLLLGMIAALWLDRRLSRRARPQTIS